LRQGGFTSFVGYEWTGTVGAGQNLHRNVIFRNEKVAPHPVSWVDVASASELWDRLQADCVDGNPGGEATPLQRIQIVKGWVESGKAKEAVIDVAGGPNEASVDPATCERSGAGAAQLCTVWSDPAFDPAAPAYYYARVLENPTCRWSQHFCVAAKLDCTKPDRVPEALAPCCDPKAPRTIQERALSSPIWYAPTSDGKGTSP
jgi:hypothetical protein